MIRRCQPLAALLALAVLCAQIVGFHRGYLCDCGGVEHLTALDHCHGPHDHDCEDEEHEMPSHDHHDHDEEEPLHEHPALVESLQVEKAPSAAFSPAEPHVLAVLPLEFFSLKDLPPLKRVHLQPPRENSRAGPFWPSLLSRSITLLI